VQHSLLLPHFPHWGAVVDFASLSAFLTVILTLARDAKALRTAMLAVGLYAASLGARSLEMLITAWVLEASSFIGAAVLILAFHSEIRYAIIKFNGLFRLWPSENGAIEGWSRTLTDAVFAMAEARIGAIIVITGRVPIADLTTPGIRLRADVSKELLHAIFHKDSPLHDGAVVIENGALSHANVVLPLSERDDLPPHYGTRHRAGLGLSERADALVIVVSEERGEVSFMRAGRFAAIENPEHLVRRLSATRPHPSGYIRRFAAALLSDPKMKLTAAALAGCICLGSAFYDRTMVRVVSVPVEFTDVPQGTELLRQSTPNVILQLRGNTWSLNAARLSRLVAHFKIRNSGTGTHEFTVNSNSVDLPPGISLESATPSEVSVQIVRPTDARF
jgi:diadenylate cyclase